MLGFRTERIDANKERTQFIFTNEQGLKMYFEHSKGFDIQGEPCDLLEFPILVYYENQLELYFKNEVGELKLIKRD